MPNQATSLHFFIAIEAGHNKFLAFFKVIAHIYTGK
jgi:hypothetical protein